MKTKTILKCLEISMVLTVIVFFAGMIVFELEVLDIKFTDQLFFILGVILILYIEFLIWLFVDQARRNRYLDELVEWMRFFQSK